MIGFSGFEEALINLTMTETTWYLKYAYSHSKNSQRMLKNG